jgi:ATP-dependent Clp protease ATP-binding subunit ClpC
MDASNIIKPALSRGELQCIGATTLNEYRKHIEKDSALERRFQSVKVEAPSVEDTIKILEGLRPKYEQHHRAEYTDAALHSAAKLSERYLTGRFLPDKAIDVIDEAGARGRIKTTMIPEEFKTAEVEIEKIKSEKEAAIKEQDFEKAASLRDKEKEEREAFENRMTQWRKERDETRVKVDEDDVLHIISNWTGIPLQRMAKEDMDRLMTIGEELHGKVVAQDEAVEALAKALRRSRADLKDPKRPIGSFIFLGPTGVGKTHLAKQLANHVFGEQDSLIQLDMSEYMEKFNVSRLVGSPPGYVGYEEGGQLTEKVRRRPYSVVLFDEIEKAHPDIWNILLQILEDGRITDSLGRKVDFRNTIIIMTSNVGAEFIKKNSVVGFGAASDEPDYEQIKSQLLNQAKKVFKPEFLNRLTDIIVFHSLKREHLSEIVNLEIASVEKRLEERSITLKLSKKAIEFLIEKGYDPAYGARPLRRAVEKYLEDAIAEEIIKGTITEAVTVNVDYKDGDENLKFRIPKSKSKGSDKAVKSD